MKLIFSIILYFVFSLTALGEENTISLKQVTKDITYLASDELKGRSTFSEGIDKAADYIAKRFEEIGLSPLPRLTNFKQSFSIYQVKVDSINLNLNGQELSNENTLLFSKHKTVNWSQVKTIKQVFIGEKDNFRESMSKVNRLKEDVLVVVDLPHEKMFTRYKSHFGRGSFVFETDKGPSALIVLSPLKKISQLTLNAKTKAQSKKLSNVVGQLKGKREEMVLFSSHYDHLGIREPNTDKQLDSIFNGADDDASGTAAVINLAEHFSKRSSIERTLVFIAFTAEELGGFGSKYFSNKLDPNEIVAMLNMEMIGKVSKFGAGQLWMTGGDKSNLLDILNQSLTKKSKQIYLDPYPKQNLFYRSDNATLAKLGVPAHSFSSSQIDKDEHYHQVSDEVKTLDLVSMREVIQTLSQSVDTLVDGSKTPTRVDTNKIKPKGSFY